MTDHGSIPLDSNFDFKFILAWTGCSSTFWRLPVARNQGRLLRPQALLHFSNIFFAFPHGGSLISCSYTQPPDSLSRNIFHQIFTHSQLTFLCRGIAKITLCNWNLAIIPRLNWRITMFTVAAKNIDCGSHLWWHIIIGCSQFGGLKSLKKLFFKKMFL